MRMLIVLAACLVIVGAFFGGASLYIAHVEQNKQESFDYLEAKELLSRSKPQEAMQIIHRYTDQLSAEKPSGIDWLPLAVDAATEEKDVSALLILSRRFPRSLQDNEEGAVLVASALLAQRNVDDYLALRSTWRGKGNKESSWLVLDADQLLLQNKQAEAKELLQSKSFTGGEDSGRLMRLALLAAQTNLPEAWNILTEARKKDPTNTAITTYRAQILEALNKTALARVEYLSAIQRDPSNPNLLLQLGEFYRRQHHYELALEAWQEGLHLPNSDQLWLKTLFWSRIAMPLKQPLTGQPPSNSLLAPLVAYLHNLPPERFWDEEAFQKLPNSGAYLQQFQETFWLRLADALQRGEEAKAAEILDFNTFHATNWAPRLQSTLQQILAYRRYGILHIDKVAAHEPQGDIGAGDENDNPHQFFNMMQQLADKSPPGLPAENIPNAMRSLLTSDYAFASAFLADQWFEAALSFPIPTRVPDTFPDWVAFAYTQALRHVKGPEQALEFAIQNKTTPSLTLLTGELFIATGKTQQGLTILKKFSSQQDDIGLKAAWLISQALIENKNYTAAKDTVVSNTMLADSTLGKETLARIALQQGDIKSADNLYGSIENDSLEAKMYLARRAFANKEWNRSLKLTEQLVIEFPDNAQLQKDLQKLRELTKPKE